MKGVVELVLPMVSSSRFARALFLALRHRLDRENNVVVLIGELEHQLHAGQLVRDAKIDRGGGADKVHGFRGVTHPRVNITEIKAGLFLLEQYAHTLQGALR